MSVGSGKVVPDRQPGSVSGRMYGADSYWEEPERMLRLIIGVAAGYVLGAKAGRARYEQISKTTRAVAASPVTRKLVQASRQKLSDRLNTQPRLEPMEPIDERTTVLVPQDQLRR
jgi:hypothetical protein